MFRHVLVHASEYPSLEHGQAWPGLLSPREEQILAGLVFLPRRRKWLLGRAAVKRLVREISGDSALQDDTISVLNQPSGAPFVLVEGQGGWPYSISISHRNEVGMAAAPMEPGIHIGADVETIEPRDPALVRQFFTDDEAESVAGAGTERDLVVARIWSAKEAFLKLLGLGLRLDTRAIAVNMVGNMFSGCPSGWWPIDVKLSAESRIKMPPEPFRQTPRESFRRESFRIVWRQENSNVLTVAVATAALAPPSAQTPDRRSV
jgi:phosphopantetheinyl transferase